MELSHDLPDSTDWIDTSLPAFEPLEAALRCEVCKEFYNNPVITSCSHTFCSLCIRRCIGADGKCPACKSACQADKLMPNIAVREVVTKFQEARSKALELARKDKEDSETSVGARKRKVEEAELDEEEPVRQTRARQTRRSARRGETAGTDDAPFVILDSEEEKDGDYLPEGMAKCPICQELMKAHLVFDHVNTCTGEPGDRSTRSRKPSSFPTALQTRPKEPTPPTSRLSGLNYAMLTESALKKKLRDLGIPSTGSKALLIRRHQEWLNIYNSNCDASDAVRKSKRELLRELDEWERTQGGNANTKESYVMKKDFDGQGHAMAHKSQFDDLIANARKRAKAVQKSEPEGKTTREPNQEPQQQPHVDQSTTTQAPHPSTAPPPADAPAARPYEHNESALSTIKAKVDEANRTDSAFPSLSCEKSSSNDRAAKEAEMSEETTLGFQDPFRSPSRKVPMFALPAEPVCDVDSSTAIQ
ncbi:DNA repair protein rad18 [Lentithecium fluviatile CBS 122367]|uniref:Postreplication repair E3 ubiquitin-protein ligase RAD18 n=1 Tax=Lentithecium fluviatile CBS 122367 TaxID=1168545 RepID=A0A6G1IVX2_9PLEO|nr:DNA repair protein rad18 [Lentithecium fluviatile CBS 122367]